MRRSLVLAVPLCLMTGAAAAYPDRGGFVDGYYIPTTKEDVNRSGVVERDFSGHGFGARAMVPLPPMFVITGEYQRSTYDDFNTDQYRVGFGVQSSPEVARLTAYGEYVNIKLDGQNRSNGFGLHLRGTFDVMPVLNLFAELGYLNVSIRGDKSDGPEFLVGASYAFAQQWAVFADYRISRIATSNDDKTRLDDLRTGVRFYLTR